MFLLCVISFPPPQTRLCTVSGQEEVFQTFLALVPVDPPSFLLSSAHPLKQIIRLTQIQEVKKPIALLMGRSAELQLPAFDSREKGGLWLATLYCPVFSFLSLRVWRIFLVVLSHIISETIINPDPSLGLGVLQTPQLQGFSVVTRALLLGTLLVLAASPFPGLRPPPWALT